MSADNDYNTPSIADMMTGDGPIDLFATEDSFQKAKPGTGYHVNGQGPALDNSRPLGSQAPNKAFEPRHTRKEDYIGNLNSLYKLYNERGRNFGGVSPDSLRNVPHDPKDAEALFHRNINHPASVPDRNWLLQAVRNNPLEWSEDDQGNTILRGRRGKWTGRKRIGGKLKGGRYIPGAYEGKSYTYDEAMADPNIQAILAKQYQPIYALDGTLLGAIRGDGQIVYNSGTGLERREPGLQGERVAPEEVGVATQEQVQDYLDDVLGRFEQDKETGMWTDPDAEMSGFYAGMPADDPNMTGSSKEDRARAWLDQMVDDQFPVPDEGSDEAASTYGRLPASEAFRGLIGRALDPEQRKQRLQRFNDKALKRKSYDFNEEEAEIQPKVAKRRAELMESEEYAPQFEAISKLPIGKEREERENALIAKIEAAAEKQVKDEAAKYTAGRDKQRTEAEDFQQGIQRTLDAGEAAKELQSKSAKQGFQEFGGGDHNLQEELGAIRFNPKEPGSFRSILTDRNRQTLTDALAKVFDTYGDEAIGKNYKSLLPFKGTGIIPSLDEYNAKVKELGSEDLADREFKTERLKQALSALREAAQNSSDPGMQDAIKAAKLAQSAADIEKQHPVHNEEERILRDEALNGGDLSSVNLKVNNPDSEESRFSQEDFDRMKKNKSDIDAKKTEDARKVDAEKHKNVHEMAHSSGEEQSPSFSPTKEEAKESVVRHAMANNPETLGEAFKRRDAQFTMTPVAPKLTPGEESRPAKKTVETEKVEQSTTNTPEKKEEKTMDKKEEEPKSETEQPEVLTESSSHNKAFNKSIADIFNEDDEEGFRNAQYIRTPWNLVDVRANEPLNMDMPKENKGADEHHIKQKMPSIKDLM